MDEITIKSNDYTRTYVEHNGEDTIKIKVTDLSKVSDGYHTIEELYDHRCILFLAFLQQFTGSWISKKHADGTSYDGWFVAGIELPTGKQITYHIPDKFWDLAKHCATATETSFNQLDKAPLFDGHTSADVLDRLIDWIEKSKKGEIKKIVNGEDE